MQKTLMILVVVTVLALLAVPSFAQGAWGTPGQGAGGWWARVQPQTDQQRQFADQVSKLHEQVRTQQQQLWQLQRDGADAATLQAKQRELSALRDKLHKAMTEGRTLRQQMGGPRAWRGASGANWQGYQRGANRGYGPQHQYRGQFGNGPWCGRRGAGQFGWGSHAQRNSNGPQHQGRGFGNNGRHYGQGQGRRGGIGPNGGPTSTPPAG